MIIVDDRLSLEALAGRYADRQPVATTWSFHFRLLRALSDVGRLGALSQAASREVRISAAAPPTDRLRVLDPRIVTASAAELGARHGLNILAAELMASALHYDAEVQLSARNVGRRWPQVMADEGITFTAV